MIDPAGIMNVSQTLQSQTTQKNHQAANSSAFLESLKAYVPQQVSVINDKAAAELNLTKWRFEDLWEDPEEKDIENPYDELARILRKFFKKK